MMAVWPKNEFLTCIPGAVEVRNELSRKLGLELPSTAVFDYPTVSALCKFIGTVSAQIPGRVLSTVPRVYWALTQQTCNN